MNVFHCDRCGNLLYFENVRCLSCGCSVGYLPGPAVLTALEPAAETTWRALDPAAGASLFRQCENGRQFEVCNWLVAEEDPSPFCTSCALNLVIPDLSVEGNLQRWQKLEQAKRRVIDTVLRMGLTGDGVPHEGRAPLRFQFLGATPDGVAPLTGHADGLITLNIAEADEDERERRRLKLREPYRTLVGHFRHEIAHYYWDLLIKDTPRLDSFRALFGDETADYGTALQTYYSAGPPADWPARFITAYASSHPWEDWAESWAHYLHIMDTMETAGNFDLQVEPAAARAQRRKGRARKAMATASTLAEIIENWVPLTCALNELNRGMGLPDLYPFVLPEPALTKLHYIHELLAENRARSAAGAAILPGPDPVR